MEEADKLIGAGKKHLVMGKVVEAVSSLQEACGMLAKTYGDTADECGEAFFWCGKALLDLARMENSVLGNALEGVPEEDEDNKPNDSKIESTEDIDEKTRDELRVQVYDAMAEKKAEDAEKKAEDAEKKAEDAEKKAEDAEKKAEDAEKKAEDAEKKAEGKQSGDGDVEEESEDKENVEGKPSESKKQMDVATGDDQQKTKEEAKEEKMAEGDGDISESKSGDQEEGSANQPEEAQGDDEEDGDEGEMETEAQGEEEGTAEKDSDDEEVGNLQLAWEMLEVAKVIYKRKETKEDQLMAAQAYLKLGEVSTESGNYTQALEDFQECLKLQQKHLDSDSRLLAETHYQLGLTYSLNLEFNKAIEALNNSISVIKSRLDKLQELLDKAECPDALADERKEMDELKALLPEIQEKVEDATEGLKTASTATQAVKDVLDGGATTSASSVQSSGLSSSNANDTATNGDGVTNGQTSTASVSDISHLVRKKRKPEESPVKEGVVKKVKQDDADGVQEAHTNGIDKATSDTKNMVVESQ